MKTFFAMMILAFAGSAYAGNCAELYNKAIGNTKVFTFNEDGALTVGDKKKVAVFEKKAGLVVLGEKGRSARYQVRYSPQGDLSSITITGQGPKKTTTFPAECASNETSQILTPGKIEAAEAESQKASEKPAPH